MHDIRHILLCDLPDFDGLLGQHREIVMDFLQHLDLLLWVTSPEKYADKQFHDFLHAVPKAEQNFTFVLNKSDILFDGVSSQEGYEQLEIVTRRFRALVLENGITEPLLYRISAEEAKRSNDLSPWNQFTDLKQQIFQHRDIKQITAIKTANLDTEIKALTASLTRELIHLKAFERILTAWEKEGGVHPDPWRTEGKEVIDLWLQNHLNRYILRDQNDAAQLVGPGRGIALLIGLFRKRPVGDLNVEMDPSLLSPPEYIIKALRSQIQHIEDTLCHRLNLDHFPRPYQDRIRAVVDVKTRFQDLGTTFFNVVVNHLTGARAKTLWGFRMQQYVIYLLLTACLLFALGGDTLWLAVIESPGFSNVIRLFIRIIQTLFSPGGLAALGSYLLLGITLGIRYHGKNRKYLERHISRFSRIIAADLVRSWEAVLEQVKEDVHGLRREIQKRIQTIQSLGQ
jgi:hypothetical protein